MLRTVRELVRFNAAKLTQAGADRRFSSHANAFEAQLSRGPFIRKNRMNCERKGVPGPTPSPSQVIKADAVSQLRRKQAHNVTPWLEGPRSILPRPCRRRSGKPRATGCNCKSAQEY